MSTSLNSAISLLFRNLRHSTPRAQFVKNIGSGENKWITEAALCRIENSQSLPTFNTIECLAQRAEIPLHDVFRQLADILDNRKKNAYSEMYSCVQETFNHLFDENFSDQNSQLEDSKHLTVQIIKAEEYISQWNQATSNKFPWVSSLELCEMRNGKRYVQIEDLHRLAIACGYDSEEVFSDLAQRLQEFTLGDFW